MFVGVVGNVARKCGLLSTPRSRLAHQHCARCLEVQSHQSPQSLGIFVFGHTAAFVVMIPTTVPTRYYSACHPLGITHLVYNARVFCPPG